MSIDNDKNTISDSSTDNIDPNNSTKDELYEHIERNNLPYTARPPTRSDGNCWYDAIADQVVVNGIQNLPKTHQEIRKLICDEIQNLPQAKTWRKTLFQNKKENFEHFVNKQ